MPSQTAPATASKYHGTPLMAAATEGSYEAAAFLLAHGADPNKSTFGMRPARFVLGEATCWHDVRKPPRQSCKTCQERLLWLHMLAVLRKYGGRPLVGAVLRPVGMR